MVGRQRFGLRFKFLLIISSLLLLIIGVIAVFLVRSTTTELRGNLRRETRSFATLATTPIGDTFILYKDSGTANINRKVASYAKLDSVISNISIAGLDGQILFSQQPTAPAAVSANQAASFEPVFISNRQGLISRIIYPYFEVSGAHRYSVIYDVSSRQIDDQLKRQARDVIGLAAGALVITILATFSLIDLAILRPVRNLSRQAAAISAGNLEQQIDASGRDEIARLGTAVNTMANKLKADIAQLQQIDKTKSEFMMIASHNLRTPLTIINGYLEAAGGLDNLEQLRKVIEHISDSAKRLSVFSEDVLTIARFELGGDIDQASVNLTDFVKQIGQEFGTVCKQQERDFSYEIDAKPRTVRISPPYIRSAIWNILDNALKFTPKGGQIKLTVGDDGQTASLSVSDTGIGISEDELPKLFTKFHRGTSTLQYDYEGTGIGLYASKIIILRHGGDITVRSQPGQGSSFSINLPLVA